MVRWYSIELNLVECILSGLLAFALILSCTLFPNRSNVCLFMQVRIWHCGVCWHCTGQVTGVWSDAALNADTELRLMKQWRARGASKMIYMNYWNSPKWRRFVIQQKLELHVPCSRFGLGALWLRMPLYCWFVTTAFCVNNLNHVPAVNTVE